MYHGGFLARIGRPYIEETARATLRDAARMLAAHDEFQGVFVINNTDLMAVGQGFYALCLGSKLDTSKERWKYAHMEGCGFDWHPCVHVGYLKTRPVRRDIPQLPYHLYVDKDGYTSLDYKTKVKLEGAIAGATPALYKELIARDAEYVYMTSAGPIFV